MTNNIFCGEKVRLRAMEASDWEAFHALDADTEMARLGWRSHFPRSREQAQQWAADAAAAKPDGDKVRLVIENRVGEVVGSINIHQADQRMGVFEYGISLGRQHWRKGYAREAIALLLKFYCGELRYQKVLVTCYAFNEASIKLHESLGFQHEGRMRRMIFSGGQFHDELLLGMTVEEFEARTK